MKISPRARHQARKKTLQALYQWLMSNNDIFDIEQQFLLEVDHKKVDVPYFQQLLQGVPAVVGMLDEHITHYLDRSLQALDPIELTILRMATYELCECRDIPYQVIINEALELSILFGATDSHKYVNGVLDKLAKQLRE